VVLLSIPPQRNIVVLPDGSEHAIAAGVPLADPSNDGWIPLSVGHSPDTDFQFQWISASGAVQPGAHTVASAASVTWILDRLYYSTTQGNQSFLVSERPGDAKSFPNGQGASVVEVRKEWALLQNGASLSRFNAATGALEPFQPMTDKQAGLPYLDNDGSLSLQLFDEQTAGLYATRDLGRSFQLVGHEVHRGKDMFVLGGEVSAGTYVISGQSQLFVPQADVATQLVRPQDSVQRDLATLGAHALSADGQCLASIASSQSELTLQVLSVGSGKSLQFKSPGAASSSQPMWIE
jgi:hypothetical protein